MLRALIPLKGYGIAILLCGVMLPVAVYFDAPSSCFFPVVVASSLLGGRSAGWLAIGLSSWAFEFFFLLPRLHFAITQNSYLRFAVFVGSMILVAELIEWKKRADRARLQLEMDFYTLAETCPDSILAVNSDLVIQFANPAVTRMFGYSMEEVIGKSSSLLFPELQSGQMPNGEYFVSRKSGEGFYVEATFGSYSGKTTIFLRDINERRSTQGNVADKENLQLTLDAIPGLVYMWSPDGEIEYVNSHVVEYLGKSICEIRDGVWIEALHPDERKPMQASIKRHFETRQPYTMENRWRRYDGSYRWFQANIQPLRNGYGEVIRWYGLLTDIDDLRRAETSLQRVQSKLAQASHTATVSEAAASIVHEICQPICAMVANGQACLRWLSANPPNPEKGKAAVERIVRDGKDAGEIIKGLRALFKQAPPKKSLLDLREIVDEVVMLVQSRTEREHIAVDIQLPKDLPLIAGDRVQIQQVLMNLVSNAIDSMQAIAKRPKRLVIRSRYRDGVVLTEVVDQGIGVSDFSQVFDTFFTTKENGMGMGLSISRSIIEAHEGRLWGSSGATEGSVFSFTIPNPHEMSHEC